MGLKALHKAAGYSDHSITTFKEWLKEGGKIFILVSAGNRFILLLL